MTARRPGAQALWPSLYVKARSEGDRSVRMEAFDAMATGEWDLALGLWQDTELLLWEPPVAWFSINAFYIPERDGRRLRSWYVGFEHPTTCAPDGFDTFERALAAAARASSSTSSARPISAPASTNSP
ncbi:hypothetical protein ACWKT5_21790 [Streptomyces avermitilis]